MIGENGHHSKKIILESFQGRQHGDLVETPQFRVGSRIDKESGRHILLLRNWNFDEGMASFLCGPLGIGDVCLAAVRPFKSVSSYINWISFSRKFYRNFLPPLFT
jgi:hypothetical protein